MSTGHVSIFCKLKILDIETIPTVEASSHPQFMSNSFLLNIDYM